MFFLLRRIRSIRYINRNVFHSTLSGSDKFWRVKMKLFVLFGALAVVFGSAVCFRLEAVAETEPDRIIGGSIARPGQFPFQISLRGRRVVNGTVIFRHRCGGSIISDRWIITAAHCNQREFVNASNSVIVVGAHHIANDGETYQVERIVNHAGYNNVSLQNDISVVLTTRAIQFSATVRPIDVCGKVIGAAEPSIVSGWGVSEVSHNCYIVSRTPNSFILFLLSAASRWWPSTNIARPSQILGSRYIDQWWLPFSPYTRACRQNLQWHNLRSFAPWSRRVLRRFRRTIDCIRACRINRFGIMGNAMRSWCARSIHARLGIHGLDHRTHWRRTSSLNIERCRMCFMVARQLPKLCHSQGAFPSFIRMELQPCPWQIAPK